MKNIEAFQDEGYQRDLLFLMFLGSIQISDDLIDPMDAAVVERCGEVTPDGGSRADSFIRQLCAYIASGPYQTLFDPAHGHSWDLFLLAAQLRECRRRDRRPGAWRDGAFQQ